ncbi:thioredoxin domain-containing protein [Cyanobium sp. NIES-981]|uniref:thioredoxin domain-containing protein n=1 Tax=Cyanobium sp. NIES-981 TaxID=1851505 RepID=UPI0007DD8F8E|nr:thioredoxin domain-containing protein [Cyanobium sp. NIES-981]SBO43658.1 Thiol:disulfide interchange protein TxlA homolog [Cyanobium sp. NIES-981]
MSNSPDAPRPGRRERLALVVIAALLAAVVLWLRGGLQPQAPLEALARRSPELPVALADGRPTLVEFYADWCEACRTMAPAMENVESGYRGRLDVVLLNVDNPRWQPELERFAVNGIPQLELFDRRGDSVGRSIGARSQPELLALAEALVSDQPLPPLPGVGAVSPLAGIESGVEAAGTMAGPRSHG